MAFSAVLVVGGALLNACATVRVEVPSPQTAISFADYQKSSLALLRERRVFQHQSKDFELVWNAPHEWRPSVLKAGMRPGKGILLVHGLGDSPWSFHDIGQALAEQGFLVRSVLLPGHGTRPEDLMDVTLAQWRQVVYEQASALQRDVGQVYLGGFSTGANLVLEYAYAHPEIAGLALFSPGFRSNSSLDWLAPVVARFRPWLFEPDGRMPTQNTVRYLSTPTNGFAQFYRSSRMAQHLLHLRVYDKPVFMAVAQHDSVLDTDYLLDAFQARFTHPASRLVWYGTRPSALTDAARVLVREDRLPEQRISQFSHMGLLFSPANALYGEHANQRFCWNGQDLQQTQACENGAPVWYSDWGYREDGKVHARLTFNPYFDWQMSVMATVLSHRDVPSAGSGEVQAVSRYSSLESQP
ncbi:alpha/beta hydrolase [Pseudomonas sp. C11]|uniref:alpha/beta hydrolase n=1 Tax=Pseudomonas sp. C11 TaxID=3075550 RepID=UPI003A520BEE